ncbi:hypothetical protein RsoM2USA_54 [Ralstonia phage RsoM2USA]|nr:hypothetical protein RsoM2USA_54 [Ralstonia phage RsoM2USA]
MEKKSLSFWDRPEGTTGMVVGAGLVGLLGYGLYHILPFIVSILQNTLYTIVLGAAVLGLVAILLDGTLVNRLWISYKLLMRAVTGLIVNIDPIAVLKEIQKKSREKIKIVDDNRKKVAGERRKVTEVLNSFTNDLEAEKDKFNYYNAHGDEPGKRSSATKVGKLNDAINRMKATSDKMTVFSTQLDRAYNALNTIADDIDFEISIQEREFKAVKASHAAWKAVKTVFKGDDQMNSLREETLHQMADSYGQMLGEIDVFMNDSQKFIDGVDLKDAMQADKTIAMLEDLNGRNLNNLVIPAKSKTLQFTK